MNRFVPTYRLYGEDAGEVVDFRLHCESIPERSRLHDWEIRLHRHETFFQMLHISHGHGEAFLNGAYRSFEADTLLFVPPGETHGFRFSRDIGGLVLTAFRDGLDALVASDRRVAAALASSRMLANAGSRAPQAVESLHRIAAEISGHALARANLMDALLVVAVIDVARAGASVAGAWTDAQDRDELRIEQFAALVGVHYREHRPIAFYADRIGISPAHLNRIARARTGRSVQELIDLRIIEEAQRNLVFTFLSAQAIALALGFSDPAYFSRFFRKHCGVTPTAFRRRGRSQLNYL